LIILFFASCTEGGLFTGYRKEVFPVTPVTESSSKTVQILNDSATSVQHVTAMAFHAASNKEGHFQITEVRSGEEKVGQKDIFVPPMGVLNVTITYAPLNIETTEADFGGWVTRRDDRGYVDAGGDASEDAAIHRTMLTVAYDNPRAGYVYIELVGGAEPGPNGETSAVGTGGTSGDQCSAGDSTTCFRGTFSIDFPGLMSGGAIEVPMHGAIPFRFEDGAAELNMDEFPPVLIALKGNGPGEPLEGKPVDAISVIISGKPETVAKGSFDGRTLALSDVMFRIRVQLGELTYEDITPGLATAVDFNLEGLEVATEEPFDGGKIIFGVETTLSSSPSGNGLFDSFLGGARVIVKFSGALELP
jgi:hypothetical protein